MALEYLVHTKLEALAPILDEHAEWFGQIVRSAFYHGEQDIKEPRKPQSFDIWMKSANTDDPNARIVTDKLAGIHKEMLQAAQIIIEQSSDKEHPSLEVFDDFKNLYDDFMIRVRRLEKDTAMTDSGLDAETGLRSSEAMKDDIRREMGRLTRNGSQFCLIVARIDQFDDILSLNAENRHSILRQIAGVFKKCVRGFDDVYRKSDNEFLFCLKHVGISGGQSVIARIRKTFESDPQYLSVNGENVLITVSYCLSEPAPGEGIDEILGNMCMDLKQHKDRSDTILQLQEISALERYVSSMQGEA